MALNDIESRLSNASLDNVVGGPSCQVNHLQEDDNGQATETIPLSSAIDNLQPSNIGDRLHSWQSTKTTVKERLSFLFNNEILSDVHFIVGKETNQQVIPAHKLVLSVGSAVFDIMFNGVIATKSKEVELPDVEPAAFLNLLKFLYSDEVCIGPESVMPTLYTAKKFAVAALEEHCVAFFKSNLCSDNAFLMLTQARLFNELELAALCLEIIDMNTANALSAKGFTDIDEDTLNAVLIRDTLHIGETEIFSALLRWSEAECIRRQLPVTPGHHRMVLGRVFNAIRFPLMSLGDFLLGPVDSGLLGDSEIYELIQYFPENSTLNEESLDTSIYSIISQQLTVNRCTEAESRWAYSDKTDRIKFAVEQKIFIVEFELHGSYFCPTEYEVHLQIIHLATETVCGSITTIFNWAGTDNTTSNNAMFKDEVEILPNTSYMASCKIRGTIKALQWRMARSQPLHSRNNTSKRYSLLFYRPG